MEGAFAAETWSLFVAVHWIVRRGDVSKPEDAQVLEDAARELHQELIAGRIEVYGVETGVGWDRSRKAVPRCKFDIAAASFTKPAEIELILDNEPILHWHGHDGGRIMCRGRERWEKLRVYREAMQKRWPAPIRPGVKRGRGAPKDTRERVKEAMRRDIKDGADLANEKQEALADHYGCARKTAVDALKEVLLEIGDGITGK